MSRPPHAASPLAAGPLAASRLAPSLVARLAPRIAAIGLAAAMAAASHAPAAASTFEGCGWYVIMGCFKSYNGAKRRAGNGFLVVNTNDYPNFRNGFYCAADGPFGRKSDANSFLAGVKSDVPDAYAKKGC